MGANKQEMDTSNLKTRFQVDLSPIQLLKLEGLVKAGEHSSKKELFNEAMSLYSWAMREVQNGRRIASFDDKNESLETIVMTGLQNAYIKASQSEIEQSKVSEKREKQRSSGGFGAPVETI